MRIAFFAWESLHSVPVGGVAVHVTELAAALQRGCIIIDARLTCTRIS